jgi:hypothetical protein
MLQWIKSSKPRIWLMPFQPSPGRDDGYDISDYYGVDPRYGTLGDFVDLTHGCRRKRPRIRRGHRIEQMLVDVKIEHHVHAPNSDNQLWVYFHPLAARARDTSRVSDCIANCGFPGIRDADPRYDSEPDLQ